MKNPDLALEPERAEPLLVLLRELLARPVHRLFGQRIEPFLEAEHRGLLIVVSFDHRAIEVAHDVQALLGKSVVAHDIPHAHKVRAFLVLRVGEDRLQGMKVGVNVAEYGKSHGE